MLEHFLLPSESLFAKLKSCSVGTLKAAQLLCEIKAISSDVILKADESIYKKSTLLRWGLYWADKDGNSYKGIVD